MSSPSLACYLAIVTDARVAWIVTEGCGTLTRPS
jgi:hypothetical protein